MQLGLTVRLTCGPLDVVITSYPLQVTEPSYLESAGVDVESRAIIAIKSLQHFRAKFDPLVDDVIFADSGGLVSNQYHRFPYRNVRRPIWPLDPDTRRQ
jgi:microcystin degradation protein MlrC